MRTFLSKNRAGVTRHIPAPADSRNHVVDTDVGASDPGLERMRVGRARVIRPAGGSTDEAGEAPAQPAQRAEPRVIRGPQAPEEEPTRRRRARGALPSEGGLDTWPATRPPRLGTVF